MRSCDCLMLLLWLSGVVKIVYDLCYFVWYFAWLCMMCVMLSYACVYDFVCVCMISCDCIVLILRCACVYLCVRMMCVISYDFHMISNDVLNVVLCLCVWLCMFCFVWFRAIVLCCSHDCLTCVLWLCMICFDFVNISHDFK